MSPGADARQWLFVYGSLVGRAPAGISRRPRADGIIVELPGYRRIWGVAMDNRERIPGYKCYLDPATGAQPALAVAFLDIAPWPDMCVNGICVPVSADELARLDHRERQYMRVELGPQLSVPMGGTVWAYVGSPAGRGRRREADRARTAVVARDYLASVEAAFDRLGPAERRAYDRSTAPPGCPVIALTRREL